MRMPRTVLIVLVFALCIGCHQNATTKQGASDKLAQFLEEARAGAKLLTVNPTSKQVMAMRDRVTTLYTQLPPTSPETTQWLDIIMQQLTLGADVVRIADELERAGSNKNLSEAREKYQECGQDAVRIIDSLRSKLYP